MADEMVLPESIPTADALSTAQVASVDLSDEYWSPKAVGESKRMIFMGIEVRKAPDHQDKSKAVELPCAVFIEPLPSGPATVINGSVRLKAVFENNEIDAGTPVQVTYKGKKTNRTNANQSDSWGVQLLKVKGADQ